MPRAHRGILEYYSGRMRGAYRQREREYDGMQRRARNFRYPWIKGKDLPRAFTRLRADDIKQR